MFAMQLLMDAFHHVVQPRVVVSSLNPLSTNDFVSSEKRQHPNCLPRFVVMVVGTLSHNIHPDTRACNRDSAEMSIHGFSSSH